MKGKLIIQNVGPIKDVTINLNKINVIIGKQGSGKSTIAKLISFFAWVEKEICIKENSEYFRKETNLYDRLVSFHKLEGYFNDMSFVRYDSDFVSIIYNHGTEPVIIPLLSTARYSRTKISYIPAERNIVATIPNWFEIKLGDNNIRSFMADWETSRKLRTTENPIAFNSSEIKYYYNPESKEDVIQLGDVKLAMTNAASGFQSMIPMFAIAEYVTNIIYKEEAKDSIEVISTRNALLSSYLGSNSEDRSVDDMLINIESAMQSDNFDDDDVKLFIKAISYAKRMTVTQLSNLIIEEPEQNLFPQTQRDAIYRLLNLAGDDRVSLTITTHSPYVLYAINNCIMGGLVEDIIPEDVSENLLSKPNWVDPTSVSIWQITDKGGIISVQNKKTNTLKSQYLNDSMNEVMNEYFTMLKYLK